MHGGARWRLDKIVLTIAGKRRAPDSGPQQLTELNRPLLRSSVPHIALSPAASHARRGKQEVPPERIEYAFKRLMNSRPFQRDQHINRRLLTEGDEWLVFR